MCVTTIHFASSTTHAKCNNCIALCHDVTVVLNLKTSPTGHIFCDTIYRLSSRTSIVAHGLQRPVTTTHDPNPYKLPLGTTDLLRRLVRGTRTLSKLSRALSTPLRLILTPMSTTVTPGNGRISLSRTATRIACTPYPTPSITNCAKTIAWWACTAPLVIQYLQIKHQKILLAYSCILKNKRITLSIINHQLLKEHL